jgi:hypothetical protein
MKAPLIKVPLIATGFGRIEHGAINKQALTQLKLGQQVDAFVLSNNHHGQVKLRLGNTELTAATTISVPNNTFLRLKVIQLRPQLLLQLLPTTSENAALNTLQQTATRLLPRQNGLAPSLSGLLNQAFIDSRSREHYHIRTLIQSLGRAIPERRSISQTEGLRQAILHSGLFLEAILSRAHKHKKSDTSKDLKACLLRLQRGFEQHEHKTSSATEERSTLASQMSNSVSPPTKKGLPLAQQKASVGLSFKSNDIEGFFPEIINRTQSALSRIGLLQIYSAENFNQGEHLWQIELPVQHNDAIEVVSISIEKEDRHGLDKKPTSWVVNLAVDLPMLGAIQIRISVFQEGVSSSFRPASSTTAELIGTQFDRLRSQLETRGVKVITLSCQDSFEDLPPADSAESTMDIIV